MKSDTSLLKTQQESALTIKSPASKLMRHNSKKKKIKNEIKHTILKTENQSAKVLKTSKAEGMALVWD